MTGMWTIQEVAKATGTTSRTLRHYDAIGLLKPAAIGENGYRLYDARALVRLQRILALRALGLGLPEIARVLDDALSEEQALLDLEQRLRHEAMRLDRQIASVQRTREAIEKGRSPMTENMFDGFDPNEYKEEVEERWGRQAWQRSNDWWNSLGAQGQADYQQEMAGLISAWKDAYNDGVAPASDTAQDLARRNCDFLLKPPGPHTNGECTVHQYVTSLGEMYVNDPRFAATYGGVEVATLVRDAFRIYAENEL